MIDSYFRSPYQKRIIGPVLKWSYLNQFSPSFITLLGLLSGLVIPFLLTWNLPFLALFFLMLSGFFDSLDGSLARKQKLTSNRGAVLDIISDRIVESSVIIGLYIYDPSRGLLCLLMLTGILSCVTSFLVVGIFTTNKSEKSFHYSPGLIERAEAFIFFSFLMLFPTFFIPLASIFIGLLILTTSQRTYQFYTNVYPAPK